MSNQKEQDADHPAADVSHLNSALEGTSTASLSSQMELENCITNLMLVHEIVMNGDTVVHLKTSSSPDSVTEIVRQAFWDRLRQQLSSNPPNYTHAVILLQEFKTVLESLLVAGHVRLNAQLDEVLDLELIQQEISHGALNLHRLTENVIDTLLSVCVPMRDQEIIQLKELEDPVDLLRALFHILDMMKLDLINVTIPHLKPLFLEEAAQYERTKFQEILEKEPDCLDYTMAWLRVAVTEEVSAVRAQSECAGADNQGTVSITGIFHRAYLRLLHWDPQDQTYPETVLMDQSRLDALGQQLQNLVLEASVLLLTHAQCGGAVFSLHGFVDKLRQSIVDRLKDSHTSLLDLKRALLSLGDTVIHQVAEAVACQGGAAVTQENLDLLKGQIFDLWRQSNPVRTLIGERVQGFLEAMLQGGTAEKSPDLSIPLRLLSAKLDKLGTSFKQIIDYNLKVFGPFYTPILRRLLPPPG